MDDVAGDLTVSRSLVIPAAELEWRFSRSSGPGGQSVNTSDSRVELSWDPRTSLTLTDSQRARLTARAELTARGLTVVAAEHRSQWQNRRAARIRLAERVVAALAPPPRRRRRTRPTRSSVDRRISAKRRRSEIKRGRGRLSDDG